MNMWSNDTQFNSDAMFIQQKTIPLSNKNLQDNSDNDSLTDVSSIIEIESSFINYDQASKYNNASIERKQTIHSNTAIHDPYVPDDELFQSLVDYANSFSLDETFYSIVDVKKQLNPINSIKQSSTKQRTQSSTSHVTSFIENDRLRQHKNYEDLRHDAQSKIINQLDSTKSIPSHFFSLQTTKDDDDDDDDNNDKHSDDNTTVTDGSKFDWEYCSDSIEHSNKSSTNLFQNYQVTTNINDIKSNYLQDFQELSSASFANNKSCSPIIIRVKIKNPTIQKNKDNQFLRPHTSLLQSTPIIVQEIFHKSSPSNRSISKHDLQTLSTPSNDFYSPSKSFINPKRKIIDEPIPLRRHKHYANEQPKKIIIEYDQINVTVNKNIKQRKEIKRVNPNQYIQQYGNSLCSNEVFRNLLTNIIS
ncbi:unnamed protein product [Rotaria sordida]|uniref:Uncharacterized protein n=1 Tax=Rotaria sordida TaxID=392033 RepID=A0A813QL41_9BILA|nr:unnamed protein product [Rotaria sordida]